jgi:hypothetical protein
VILKGGKEEKQYRPEYGQCKKEDKPMRTLQALPTKVPLSTHLISIGIEHCPGENG